MVSFMGCSYNQMTMASIYSYYVTKFANEKDLIHALNFVTLKSHSFIYK